MSTKTEGQHTAEFLLAEAPGTISRDTVTVTVPANTTWDPGKVLAKLTATGKHVEYDDVGNDGSEEAAAILFDTLTNDTDGDVDVDAVVINFCAEVRAADLGWKDGLSGSSQTAGLADLAAQGIKAR